MPADMPSVISHEARNELEKLLKEFKAHTGKDAIPAILWIDPALNEGKVDAGIGIGYYTNRDEIADDIEIVDGFEIVFAMSDKDRARFFGKTVHFTYGKFTLV